MYETLVFVRYGPLFSVYELGRLLRMGRQWGGEKENKPLIVLTLLPVCLLCHFSSVRLFVTLMDCIVRGISQARILEGVSRPFSRGSS